MTIMNSFWTWASDVESMLFGFSRIPGFVLRPAVAEDEGASDRAWSRLMVAAQDGDRGAYERLLREILPLLHAVIERLHRDPDRIDGVIQEVLLAVHLARHTYDPARPFRHWLMAIAHRQSDLCRADR
jgi:RNA polymerase sigma-70 factor (ECF subfamily)